MSLMLRRMNRVPSVEQLLLLAGRAGGKRLQSAEVRTLRAGIEALAAAAGEPAPARVVSSSTSVDGRLLDAALRLYAACYGLSVEQAEADVRAEAGL